MLKVALVWLCSFFLLKNNILLVNAFKPSSFVLKKSGVRSPQLTRQHLSRTEYLDIPLVREQIDFWETSETLGLYNNHQHYQNTQESASEITSEVVSKLFDDIELLSGILGEVIKLENEDVFKMYQEFCQLALKRANGDPKALSKMIEEAIKMTPDNFLGVVRAFTQTLNLINAAEVHQRMRVLRNADKESNRVSPLPAKEDSIGGAIDNIIQQERLNNPDLNEKTLKDTLYEKLIDQSVDIVLTAHPTEVNRRTLLRKYRTISEILSSLDHKDLTPFEKNQAIYSLKREIASIWGSDEIRRQKPTPQQEARGGLAILESVLWDAVPSYLRKLNLQVTQSLGKSLPLTTTPIKFSSWMGGDRDGNPNVTPTVTFEVATTQRLQAAKLLLNDIVALYQELAVCKGFSREMMLLASTVKKSFDRLELYRRILGHVRERLLATIEWCEKALADVNAEIPAALHISTTSEHNLRWKQNPIQDELSIEGTHGDVNYYSSIAGEPNQPFFDKQELLSILQIIHESLTSGGYADVADGLLVDVIRRVSVFGLTLVPLDIREESSRHTKTIDCITRYLGIGSFAQWDEPTKLNWLNNELLNKRPLFRTRDIDSLGFPEDVVTTLRTFETMSKLGPGSLGAYVISQSKAASDVLAVMLLQKQFGMTSQNKRVLRVVPLFETLDDLTNSPRIVEDLFSIPNYVALINNKQEIMVGYSDSSKDAGRLAASWSQYEAQEKMVKVAEKYNVKLTFFHGKGGTVGRGGNPALYRAVLAHPPRTINGKFRVTEQGEMITQNFGSTGIAERTLDIYTAAVLSEQFIPHVSPKPEWREYMAKLSEVSCNAYRNLIKTPAFIQYFKTATPEMELSTLNIGSRPSKRNPAGGIESLRAIPWTFAWTQTRLHLPAWMGVGEALDPKNHNGLTLENLQSMYNDWPFFREMIDLIAMTLSKTDYSIAAIYELQLVRNLLMHEDHELEFLGNELRQKLIQTRCNLLEVTGCEDLSSGFRLLQMSMKVRYPYVDPLNIFQAEIMRRLRIANIKSSEAAVKPIELTPEQLQSLKDALLVSINGIAQGMKNSG